MRIKKSTVENLPRPEATQKGRTAQKKSYDDQWKGFGVGCQKTADFSQNHYPGNGLVFHTIALSGYGL